MVSQSIKIRMAFAASRNLIQGNKRGRMYRNSTNRSRWIGDFCVVAVRERVGRVNLIPVILNFVSYWEREVMKENTGVWIDHREAIIVHLTDSGHEISRVQSDAEKQPRRSSDQPSGSFESLQVQSDDKRQRKYSAELARFYDEVASHLDKTTTLLIFGPGEAKMEFQKQLDSSRTAPQHISVETADKMTDAQIVAKVVAFFE